MIQDTRPQEKPAGPTACNILCPGPSLDRFDPERDLVDGPVVALNGAIAVYPTADVWAIDGGNNMKRIEEVLNEYGYSSSLVNVREVWSMVRWDHDHGKVAEESFEGRRNLIGDTPFFGWPRGIEPVARRIGWRSRVPWSAVGPLCPAILAIERGVKHLRVIGADFTGSGYGGIDGGPFQWKPEEDPSTRKRWRMAKNYFGAAQKECEAQGIALERYAIPEEQAPEAIEPAKDQPRAAAEKPAKEEARTV